MKGILMIGLLVVVLKVLLIEHNKLSLLGSIWEIVSLEGGELLLLSLLPKHVIFIHGALIWHCVRVECWVVLIVGLLYLSFLLIFENSVFYLMPLITFGCLKLLTNLLLWRAQATKWLKRLLCLLTLIK